MSGILQGVLASIGGATPYMDVTTSGATVTTSGNYKVAVFGGSGSFTVNKLGSDTTEGSVVEYLVVAGGGGGGDATQGPGGGGAGGMLSGTNQTVLAQAYTITVGAGGAAKNSGINSSFGSLVTTIGGGFGGHTSTNAASGGSGGGARGPSGSVGSGTSGQGSNGNFGSAVFGKYPQGGGGGGKGGTSSSASPNGLPGQANSITGSSLFYAGGGGGYSTQLNQAGTGGSGVGGSGGSTGSPGVANRGGGGGGGNSGGAGGSGVVIIKWRFQ